MGSPVDLEFIVENSTANIPGIAQPRPEQIFIELDAVRDSLTMLRGFLSNGKIFPDFTSQEITRFPTFDTRGKHEWRLPHNMSFHRFLDIAIDQHHFLSRVRPYDFAQRDLTYLRGEGVKLVIYVPPHQEKHLHGLREWAEKYFPAAKKAPPVGIMFGDIENVGTESGIWVARSPEVAASLANRNQPYILIDGKENAHVTTGYRAMRWDQAGYLLRHRHVMLSGEMANNPVTAYYSDIEHETLQSDQDIWVGSRIIPPSANPAALWIGDQMESIRSALSDTEKRLRYDRKGKEVIGQPLSKEQKGRAIAALLEDMAELDRKKQVIDTQFESIKSALLNQPKWTASITLREARMQPRLREIELEFGIDSITGTTRKGATQTYSRKGTPENGSNITELLKASRTSRDVFLPKPPSDFITLFAQNWEDVTASPFVKEASGIAGELAEMYAVLLLRSEGWKVLRPRNPTESSVPHSLQEYTRVKVQWYPKIDPDHLLEAEVDCIAIMPSTDQKTMITSTADKNGKQKFYIFEVKLTSATALSRMQNQLKQHIDDGGSILNPDCVGIPKRLHEIYPEYRVITFDRAVRPQNTNSLGIGR